jgi:hypothetical protein
MRVLQVQFIAVMIICCLGSVAAVTGYASENEPVLLAQAKGKSSKSRKSEDKPKTREMNIVREAKYTKDRKDINFESENLYGQRKMPMSSIISQTKSDKRFDLIKIRDNWNPEMVQSTSTLELGR